MNRIFIVLILSGKGLPMGTFKNILKIRPFCPSSSSSKGIPSYSFWSRNVAEEESKGGFEPLDL